MASSRSAEGVTLARAGAVLLAILDALVEGAWLTVVYAGFEVALARHPPVLGVFEFALAAGIGIWLARRQPALPPTVWIAILIGLTLAGWLASPAARASLQAGLPLQAVADHLGGFFLGLAVIRGGAHRVPEDDDLVLGSVLRVVLPFLALPWLAGAIMPPGPLRTQFAALAFEGTLIFVILGFVALGVARLHYLGLGLDPTHSTGRAWLTVTTLVPLALVAVALPVAFWLGLQPQDLTGALIGPTSLLLTIVALIMAPLLIGLGWLLSLIRGAPGPPSTIAPAGSPGPGLPADATAGNQTLFLILVVIVVLAIVLLVVAEWLRARRRGEGIRPSPILDEHAIVIPDLHLRRPRLRLPRRVGAPHDAVGAYLAALNVLEPDEALARRPEETPAGHARRLGADGADTGGARLRHLAADYQLARYGGRRITARETARALARWRSVRSRPRA
ncbi:MAG: DUF4129 domain-containing protein [Candidatus Limnocylindrales bacterium]